MDDSGVASVHFDHGLGDCVHFAHQLPLYTRRGYRVRVSCAPDKRVLFEPCGVEIDHDRDGAPAHPYDEPPPLGTPREADFAGSNKAGMNAGRPPLPPLGEAGTLWGELCAVRLDARAILSPEDWESARAFLRPLARPVVLLHTAGNTFRDTKSLRDGEAAALCRHLLDTTDGTVVLLDWDNRSPRLAHGRVRHLTDDWERIGTPRLLALIHESDLVIGIDSGPLHAARYTDTPAVGVFNHPYHHPARVTLPRGRQINLVPAAGSAEWYKAARFAFNVVRGAGERVAPAYIAATAARVLRGPRYLDADRIGADVLLQQLVLEFCRGDADGAGLCYADRHLSLDLVLRSTRERFARPLVVETGTIRSDEDFRGAGYSTYVLGAFLSHHGGELISVDHAPRNCEFARSRTAGMSSVSVVCGDSVEFLRGFDRPVDVLLLDSLDTEDPRHADHALEEARAAERVLHDRSSVIFDDTYYGRGTFHGKGSKAVPWFLERGWRVRYSGYQVVLEAPGGDGG